MNEFEQIEKNSRNSQSSQISKYADIEKDVLLLKESMEIMHTLVNEQQDTLDTLEDYIVLTKNDIKQGETQLVIADNINRDYSYMSGVISIGAIGIMIGFVLF